MKYKTRKFDKNNFSQLKDKIFENLKQEIIAKQENRHNQKLKLENEQLKLKNFKTSKTA